MAANKITIALVYAVIEWILIILLLLNSVFTYLIIKFSQFFNLNPPCFSCARIDRFRYRLCEIHSKEVSELKFCSVHGKLAEFCGMCENCSSSGLRVRNESRNFVFSKVERIDLVRDDGENEVDLKCSCCGVSFDRKFVDDASCFVIHPLEDELDGVENRNPIGDFIEKDVLDDHLGSNYEEVQQIESRGGVVLETGETGEYAIEVTRKLINTEEDLIQFEVLDSKNEDHRSDFEDEDDHEFGEFQEAQTKSQEIVNFVHQKTEQESKFSENLIDLKMKTENHRSDFKDEEHEFGEFQEAQTKLQEIVDSVQQKTEQEPNFFDNLIDLIDLGDEKADMNKGVQEDDSGCHSVKYSVFVVHEEEENVSIGTHIPVLDSCDEIIHEESSTIYDNVHSHLENDCEKPFVEENLGDLKNLSINIEEIEEDRSPDTPLGIHSPNPFHKRWMISRPKDSGTEESFDGSVISETDGGDPIDTVEKLQSALKAERKALRDLYLELEEERNASAVAANETMAMINRLQEEKAAMQMEALQYRRMMEEQSEYDQEALQLLNELMLKKEKELELYKKKVLDYKAKEKTKTNSVSVSWSHSEDDDGASIDLYHVPKDENSHDGDREVQHPHAPVDSVLDLESTLADFEEERVSILEHLKFLEEKLVALSDEEDQHFANVKVIEDHYEETNNIGFSGQVIESTTNGFVGNGKQAMGNQLLPLFDAISIGVYDNVTVRNGHENGFHHFKFEDTAVSRFELEKKRIDMEEEIDQLYVRLQTLEANRGFLKHLIGSIKKGDKGMEVLQEILHHLRDLRDVNLRSKSYTENVLL
ncbi:myosin-binding protein 3-like [Bidens hawaiensis]|uniref:myosin-binding protein 3-like n=1 Tax=Bidens hawaiensis TaxID=980011 RepID=UPI0040498295